jgi:hypothetical protein
MLQAEEKHIRLARVRALEMLARCSRAEGEEQVAVAAERRARELRLRR